eukprot:CAMPEP_0184408360 /NCGR_PEP_ID=MMETSP0738-20130409/3178_1 /TAXON_ID=385413 /ORGANISM="Thalassiosira miniscula, Strain CCMP1093" /LENGTH=73 /DNA_ID=CAMNT_0026765789 /DNA_START=416 /DNA_END=633 /DNA_ORIENTATION=+
MAFCSGSYLARPKEFLILDLDVFFGDGDFDDDVGSEEFVGEVGYDFQVDGAFGLTLFLHGRNQSERQIDIIID